MADGSYVYVIGTRTAAPVKIGVSHDPTARLETIRTGTGCKTPEGIDLSALEVLYRCEGDRQMERALHFRFRNLRVVGEWFNLHPAVAPREVRMAASEMPWLGTPGQPQRVEPQQQKPEAAVVQVRQPARRPAPVAVHEQHGRCTDELVQAAHHHHRMFKAWIEAGFTEQQAINLLAQVVRSYAE